MTSGSSNADGRSRSGRPSIKKGQAEKIAAIVGGFATFGCLIYYVISAYVYPPRQAPAAPPPDHGPTATIAAQTPTSNSLPLRQSDTQTNKPMKPVDAQRQRSNSRGQLPVVSPVNTYNVTADGGIVTIGQSGGNNNINNH